MAVISQGQYIRKFLQRRARWTINTAGLHIFSQLNDTQKPTEMVLRRTTRETAS